MNVGTMREEAKARESQNDLESIDVWLLFPLHGTLPNAPSTVSASDAWLLSWGVRTFAPSRLNEPVAIDSEFRWFSDSLTVGCLTSRQRS